MGKTTYISQDISIVSIYSFEFLIEKITISNF